MKINPFIAVAAISVAILLGSVMPKMQPAYAAVPCPVATVAAHSLASSSQVNSIFATLAACAPYGNRAPLSAGTATFVFSHPYIATPVCNANPETAFKVMTVSVTPTQVSVTSASATDTQVVDVVCSQVTP